MRALTMLLAALSLPAFAWQPGRNALTVRGHALDLQFLPASGAPRARVLFLPGDGGWRGFAIDIARALASWGFDVVAIDTHDYLTAVTRQRALTAEEMRADLVQLATTAAEGRPLYCVGWSQGAAMAALAASAPLSPHPFHGIAAIGLPPRAVLGWRLADNVTWLTHKLPDEPLFETRPLLERLATLPFALLQSRGDEFTSPAEVEQLFAASAGPKRLLWIDAADHKFTNRRSEFYSSLHDALEWLMRARPPA